MLCCGKKKRTRETFFFEGSRQESRSIKFTSGATDSNRQIHHIQKGGDLSVIQLHAWIYTMDQNATPRQKPCCDAVILGEIRSHVLGPSAPRLTSGTTFIPPKKQADDGIAAAGLVSSLWHCLGIAWPPRPARTLIVTLFSDPNEQLASERTTVAWCGRSNRDRIAATWRVATVNGKRQNRGERGRGEGLDFHMRQTLILLILIGSRFRMKSDSDVWPNLLDSIYQRDSSTAGSEEKLSSQYYLSAEQQHDG